jgi:AraC-like DNA-binding protein
VSLHRWIAEYRLSEARRLLGETDLPINEIARRAAFQSTAAFSTAFRAAVGLAPSEFRHLNVRAAVKR